MILLDSSVIIDFFRKKEKNRTFLFELSQKNAELCISTITYYEVGIGNRKSHYDYWNKLTEFFTVIPFDKLCAQAAVEIYASLLKKNELIDLADILIGATAMAHNIPLATLNEKHFNRIKKISIIS